jgi:hypothetical protein
MIIPREKCPTKQGPSVPVIKNRVNNDSFNYKIQMKILINR